MAVVKDTKTLFQVQVWETVSVVKGFEFEVAAVVVVGLAAEKWWLVYELQKPW